MFMKEEIQAKKHEKRKVRKDRKKKERKNKMMRDSLDPGGSGLSLFEGDFLKF